MALCWLFHRGQDHVPRKRCCPHQTGLSCFSWQDNAPQVWSYVSLTWSFSPLNLPPLVILVCVKLNIKANMSILVVFLIAHKGRLQEKRFIMDHSSEKYSPSEQRKHGGRSDLVSSSHQRAEKGEWWCSEGWILLPFLVWNPSQSNDTTHRDGLSLFGEFSLEIPSQAHSRVCLASGASWFY